MGFPIYTALECKQLHPPWLTRWLYHCKKVGKHIKIFAALRAQYLDVGNS